MPPLRSGARQRRAAQIAGAFLLAVAWCALLPETARALGGPRPVTVSAQGELRRPGTYTVPPDATLSTLILAAGGFTDAAAPRGASLVRASTRTAQETELREMAARILADSGPPGEGREAARVLAERLRRLRPSGRLPVRITYPRLLKNSPDDLPLQEGDVLHIPPRTETVAVAGAVRSPSGGIPFRPGAPFGEYVRDAGGYAADADRGRVYLARADGTAALLSLGTISWNESAGRWEVTALAGGPPAVSAGDTIVVSRALPGTFPVRLRRELPAITLRAAEIVGAPVLLP
jgi:protein involved in polysaccharide export with SLBB domain